MSKILSGSFNGTGSRLKLCLGFKPDWVKVQNISSANLESVEWNRGMLDGADAVKGGIKKSELNTVDGSKLNAASGIRPYDGGDVMDADQTECLVYSPDNDDYDYAAAGEGVKVPAGFDMADVDDVNVSNEKCYFEAGFFD